MLVLELGSKDNKVVNFHDVGSELAVKSLKIIVIASYCAFLEVRCEAAAHWDTGSVDRNLNRLYGCFALANASPLLWNSR